MNTIFKMSTTCRKNNPDTNMQRLDGFSLNGHSAHFKCVPFETLTKDECQSQKIVINMKHMLRNHQISCLYECILILLIMEEGLAHRRLILNKRSPYSLVITLFIKVCDELSLQKQTPVV